MTISKLKSFLISIMIFALIILSFDIGKSVVKADLPDCSNPSSFTSSYDQSYCDIQKIKDLYAPAQATNKKNLAALQSQLADLSKKIAAMAIQLDNYQKDIQKREEDMAYTQEIFNQKAKDQYMFLRLYDPITPFLFADSASRAFQEISLRQRAADADRKSLDQYAQELAQLKKDKDTLEKSRTDLAAIQKQVNDQATFLAGEVAKVDTYLATLTAEQQTFLAQKYGTLGISLSAYNMQGGCKSDLVTGADPGFSPKFGFFTYGVPNRVGLNQFGALGRSQAGQNYKDILNAYYMNYHLECRSLPSNQISVNGYGKIDIKNYLKGLGEMPTNWGDQGGYEAFKAQVVAAASYAYAYTNNGAGSICTTDQCQVYTGSNKGGKWEQAVNEIGDICGGSGIQVMVANDTNQPIKAWYSATHGGYVFTSADIGWSSTSFTKRAQDTTGSVNSFSDLQNNAYDKNSPWFYCDWGSRKSANSTAWLTSQEVADIVNAVLLAEKDGSTKSHLYQTDKSNPEGADTWDAGRVRQELSKYLTPFSTISDISVSADFGNGKVTTVHVSGDGGTEDISGDDFKNYFDLRAPGNVQIVGPLYNVEKR